MRFLSIFLSSLIACGQSPTSNHDWLSQYASADSTVVLNVFAPATCFHCYAIYTHLPRIYAQNPALKVVYLFPKIRSIKQKEITGKINFGANYHAEFIFDSERYDALKKHFNTTEAQNFLVKITPGAQDTLILLIDHLDKSLTKRSEVLDFLFKN